MPYKDDFLSALKDLGTMSYEERSALSKSCRWCKYIGIAIVVVFTIAVFMHPTGGAG